MLVPIYLGICAIDASDTGHLAAEQLMRGNALIALQVGIVHTLAMTAAGGALAIGIYLWLGLKFLKQGWFNLDIVWALSLVIVGLVGIATALWGEH